MISPDPAPTTVPAQANVSAALFGLLAFALFSTHDVFVKHLAATYSPFQIVFLSALLSFPIITLVLISDHKPGTLQPVHPWWMALRSVTGAASTICAFFAFRELPLAEAYAFIFTAPLIITVLAIPILGEKVRLRRGLAVVAGLVGVLIVLRPGASEIGLGHIAAMCAAVAGALSAIVVRKVGAEERRVVMVLYPMLANLVITAAVLPFVWVDLRVADLGLLAIVSAMVLVAMTFLVVAYARGVAVVVAPTQYSQILWGAFYGALLFDEIPDRPTFVGAVVIILSGVYILKRESTRSVSRNTPVLETRTRAGHAIALRVSALLHWRQGKH